MGRPPSWTDAQLADAVVGAPSWAEVSRRLGMNAYGKTTTRLRRHAMRLKLDVSHLDRVRTAVTAAPGPDRGLRLSPIGCEQHSRDHGPGQRSSASSGFLYLVPAMPRCRNSRVK